MTSYQSGVLVLACLLAGCGGGGSKDAPDIVPVTGTVTQGGQPVPSAAVAFMPAAGGGAPSYGFTSTDGKFELQYNDGRPGAIPGAHTVIVTTGAPDPAAAEAAANGNGPPPKPLAPPKEYRKEVTVSDGGSPMTIDING